MFETPCTINGSVKNLLLSKSEFKDADGKINFVLIIKDLTEIKSLEKQLARNEQITAMGHLASGVAHEIRNPLNTIGTIAQQLDQDYESVDDKENYHSLTKLIYSEVRRINRAIENFLKFSRPEKINRVSFELDKLIDELELQYKSLLKNNSIDLKINQLWKGTVKWDRDKIRQVMMNLMENAKDAIELNGTIALTITKEDEDVIIILEDTGSGIEEDDLNRIFNLYYTTKAKGTGVGLSIIQRIINEHEGIITVESKINEGTMFIIKLKANAKETV
jgi:signal transduction histidine kinase